MISEQEVKLIHKIVRESRYKDKVKEEPIYSDDEVGEVFSLIDRYSTKEDLIKQFLDAMPLFYDEAGLWWRWATKKKKWILTDEIEILNFLKIVSYATFFKASERIEVLNGLKQFARARKPQEPKLTWIQFNKEVVDLETGERFEPTPEYFFTNPIPFSLGENDKTPTMDKIFEDWVGKNYVETLYEIIAYALLPDYPLQRLFILLGGGLNGKSCYLNLVRKFLGKENVCSTELDTLLTSRFEVARLYKRLVCLMGETNFNEMRQTSMLKRLTGNDLIGFEFKNKKLFEDKNYAKLVIATNNLPTTLDKSDGFYRRMLIIDFPNTFSEKKDILSEIPEKEYCNLGMKCIGILINLLEKREFCNEGSIEERMKRYEDRSDFLQAFLDESVEPDMEGYITKAQFKKKLDEWCKSNGHRFIAESTLGKLLKSKGINWIKKSFDWVHDGKGGQIAIYPNIKWKY